MQPGRTRASIARARYGVLPSGAPVDSFALTSAAGHTMQCIAYGAIITSLRVPDRSGVLDDVVLGHDTLDGYLTASRYFGAVVGRYANRIAFGRFQLDGEAHALTANNGPHHLHGGVRGFDKVLWDAEPFEEPHAVGVRFSYESRDGDEGYPGALVASVEYRLTAAGELRIGYRATATRPTPVNLTQHSYWNLAGARADTILDHELTIHADEFTPTDASLIPLGELRRVAATPFDFRAPTRIGSRIADDDEQLRRAGGYDHNFVLRSSTAGLRPAARLHDPLSGRTLEISTTEPGLQFYSGNFLDGSIRGKAGRAYGHRAGLCLETQHFPDSPNHPEFPSAILRPGASYASSTVFAFSSLRQGDSGR
jgi:aldose 1-epimerase